MTDAQKEIAKQAERIAELEAANTTARFDALREAFWICEAERITAADHNLPQMAFGAAACKRQIERKLPIKIVGSTALKGPTNG